MDKEKIETLSKKLAELTEEELAQVTGGKIPRIVPDEQYVMSAQTDDWKSDKLPTEPGNYKLGIDVEIQDKN